MDVGLHPHRYLMICPRMVVNSVPICFNIETLLIVISHGEGDGIAVFQLVRQLRQRTHLPTKSMGPASSEHFVLCMMMGTDMLHCDDDFSTIFFDVFSDCHIDSLATSYRTPYRTLRSHMQPQPHYMPTIYARRLKIRRRSAASSCSEDKWKIYCYSRKSLRILQESTAALSRVAVVIRGDFAGIAEL
jgi:hypothetical protein